MVGLIAAFASGVMFGVVTMCCCVVAGRSDRSSENINGYQS
ncbi:MAG: DUF3789 domain-containing protein [bacterium]|nr:DUF3789 domain-containing protein [bacterium]